MMEKIESKSIAKKGSSCVEIVLPLYAAAEQAGKKDFQLTVFDSNVLVPLHPAAERKEYTRNESSVAPCSQVKEFLSEMENIIIDGTLRMVPDIKLYYHFDEGLILTDQLSYANFLVALHLEGMWELETYREKLIYTQALYDTSFNDPEDEPEDDESLTILHEEFYYEMFYLERRRWEVGEPFIDVLTRDSEKYSIEIKKEMVRVFTESGLYDWLRDAVVARVGSERPLNEVC